MSGRIQHVNNELVFFCKSTDSPWHEKCHMLKLFSEFLENWQEVGIAESVETVKLSSFNMTFMAVLTSEAR